MCRSAGQHGNEMKTKKILTIFFSAVFSLSCLIPSSGFGQEPDDLIPSIRYLFSIDGTTSGRPFVDVQDLYVDDKNEEIYVMDNGSRRVVISDFNGTFLYQFSYVDAGVRAAPREISISDNGMIYIAESFRVAVLNYRGIYHHDLDLSTVPDADKMTIQSIAIEDDFIYIGDAGLDRVIVMDLDKEVFINQFSDGVGKNFFLELDDDTIYLMDPAAFSVYRIDKEGTALGRFGKVSGLPGGFSQIVDLAGGKASLKAR